jgi:hypothetical protein
VLAVARVAVTLAANSPLWTDKAIAIGTLVAALGFVLAAIGAWFAYDQIKETRRARHVELISDYGGRWDGEGLTEARDLQRHYFDDELADAVELYFAYGSSSNPRKPPLFHLPRIVRRLRPDTDVPILLRIPNYFEDLAVMVEYGHYELGVVANAFSSLAISEWTLWEPAIARMRTSDSQSYREFERLIERLHAWERRGQARRRTAF